VFQLNVDEANKLNQIQCSQVHGITKYSDLTSKEFEIQSGLAIPIIPNPVQMLNQVNSTGSLISFKNWTRIYTTAVKDQGNCGSCWAFAAAEQVESDGIRLLNFTSILSTQQVTSCDPSSIGCNGGSPNLALAYVQNAGGLVHEETYPYNSFNSNGTTSQCQHDLLTFDNKVITVNDTIAINGEESMANYVLTTGPLMVYIAANAWQTYISGILSICTSNIDHSAQIVGVDLTGPTKYWIIRNSWYVK
jgi:C1A family cysteine protease